MLERWTRAIIRGRFLVIVLWAGGSTRRGILYGPVARELLTTSLAVRDWLRQANATLTQHFGENIEGTFTRSCSTGEPFGCDSCCAFSAPWTGCLAVAARAVPGGRTLHVAAQPGAFGASSLSRRRSTFKERLRTPALYARPLRNDGLPPAYVTGAPAFSTMTPGPDRRPERGRANCGTDRAGITNICTRFFGGGALPFVVACATTAALAVVYTLAHRFLMVLRYNLVRLVGLGLAAGYSLLIVHRFREEMVDGDAVGRRHREDHHNCWAYGDPVGCRRGRSARVLIVIPVPFVRSSASPASWSLCL